MSDKELKRKIESLGVITEDKMFIKYSNDGILDLIELIQEERKEAVEGFADLVYESFRNHDLKIHALIEEYLESEGK